MKGTANDLGRLRIRLMFFCLCLTLFLARLARLMGLGSVRVHCEIGSMFFLWSAPAGYKELFGGL